MIYLDHAATTPMRPDVWDAMTPYSSGVFGNSSGVHDVSRRAKNALEEAREHVAAMLGARPMEIIFTSGGTESDNLALKGAVWSPRDRSGVVTVATEHDAILETVDFLRRLGPPTTLVNVDSEGFVDSDAVVDATGPKTAVVSVMLVNNETGLVQDVGAVAEAVKRSDSDIYVHTDAVQGFACEDVDVGALNVDMMTITAHKFGGPKGTGLLYVREGTELEPVLHGGGQELGRRSGTHDVAGAVGLARAMELAVADRERFRSQISQIRDDFEKRLAAGIDDVVLNTPRVGRSSHHLNMRIPGIRNETLLMRLDQRGVAASAGSACQSGAATVSHVLEAMGLTPARARESLRFSFGWTSTMDESIEAADIVVELVEKLR